MDFRTPRSADGRVPSRPASTSAHHPPAEPQPKVEEPKPVQRMTTTHHQNNDDSSKKRFIIPIVIVGIILLGLVAWFVLSRGQSGGAGIDKSKYQAVFFTNGQVYFGKLQSFNDDYMKLTDIYYLQTQEATSTDDKKNPQQTANDQSNVQLIKLGNEVHGPEDEMILSKEQVLFYENLKSDSKVVQTIEQNKKQ